MFNRRTFIATTVAAAVVTTLPAIADERPKIGAEFYVVDHREDGNIYPYEKEGMKRWFAHCEKERGLRFGNFKREVVWDPNSRQGGGPWAVVWEATVVGYV